MYKIQLAAKEFRLLMHVFTDADQNIDALVDAWYDHTFKKETKESRMWMNRQNRYRALRNLILKQTEQV